MGDRERLIEIVKEVSFAFSDKPVYKLASGHTSNFYFNMKKTTMSSAGLYLTGKMFYDKIRKLGLRIQGIGGLTMGADPIAYATSFYAHTQGEKLFAFSVRKEPKGHGLGLPIEGLVEPGHHVVVVDDVVTTGGSTIKALKASEQFGLIIDAVIVLVDRCEHNGRQNIEALGYPVFSLLTINDFITPNS